MARYAGRCYNTGLPDMKKGAQKVIIAISGKTNCYFSSIYIVAH